MARLEDGEAEVSWVEVLDEAVIKLDRDSERQLYVYGVNANRCPQCRNRLKAGSKQCESCNYVAQTPRECRRCTKDKMDMWCYECDAYFCAGCYDRPHVLALSGKGVSHNCFAVEGTSGKNYVKASWSSDFAAMAQGIYRRRMNERRTSSSSVRTAGEATASARSDVERGSDASGTISEQIEPPSTHEPSEQLQAPSVSDSTLNVVSERIVPASEPRAAQSREQGNPKPVSPKPTPPTMGSGHQVPGSVGEHTTSRAGLPRTEESTAIRIDDHVESHKRRKTASEDDVAQSTPQAARRTSGTTASGRNEQTKSTHGPPPATQPRATPSSTTGMNLYEQVRRMHEQRARKIALQHAHSNAHSPQSHQQEMPGQPGVSPAQTQVRPQTRPQPQMSQPHQSPQHQQPHLQERLQVQQQHQQQGVQQEHQSALNRQHQKGQGSSHGGATSQTDIRQRTTETPGLVGESRRQASLVQQAVGTDTTKASPVQTPAAAASRPPVAQSSGVAVGAAEASVQPVSTSSSAASTASNVSQLPNGSLSVTNVTDNNALLSAVLDDYHAANVSVAQMESQLQAMKNTIRNYSHQNVAIADRLNAKLHDHVRELEEARKARGKKTARVILYLPATSADAQAMDNGALGDVPMVATACHSKLLQIASKLQKRHEQALALRRTIEKAVNSQDPMQFQQLQRFGDDLSVEETAIAELKSERDSQFVLMVKFSRQLRQQVQVEKALIG